jgi:hypothetical protein
LYRPFKNIEEMIFMFVKIYSAIWFVVLFVTGVIFLTGNFNTMAAVVFGFVSFGLVFMGMMCVLPHAVTHQAKVPETGSGKEPELKKRSGEIIERVKTIKKAWMSSTGVEIGKPRYH